MSIQSGWEENLEQGEEIRWQGRPDSTVKWWWHHYAGLAIGFALSFFALIWMIAATGQGGWFWTYGLLFFFTGVCVMFVPPYWPPYLHSKTWYTLTNKRALIATDLPILGRRVNFFPITPQSPVELGPKNSPSVFFASRTRQSRHGKYEQSIGFCVIEDAEHVYALMRDIQKEAE